MSYRTKATDHCQKHVCPVLRSVALFLLLLVPALFTGQASLFTLSSSNAMVQMLGARGPRVVAANIDSKRDLEQQLKTCCEAFIMALTKAAVEPMLGFITKVTAVRLAAGSNKALAKPLKEQVGRRHGQVPGTYTRTHLKRTAYAWEVHTRTRLHCISGVPLTW